MASRRSPAPGGRNQTVMVAFSDLEMAKVVVGAGRDDLAVGAWVGMAALEKADELRPATARGAGPEMQRLMELRAELMENRRVLRNVGGNLNDIARVANSTGEVAPQTTRVQGMVERSVERIDACVVELDQKIRRLLGELQGRRS